MSISAYYVLKGRHLEVAQRSFKVALVLGLVSSLALPISGHSNANMVARHQPAKLAAFEGHFETGQGGAPLYLFGLPDVEAKKVRYGIAIPGMLSLLIHNDMSTPVPGLDQIPLKDQPPVVLPFMTYHLMVGLGFIFIARTLLAAFFLWRGKLFEQRWLMRAFVVAVIGPYLANQAGWVSAEVGRQPWIVYGHLRTADGLSEAVKAEHALASIILFGLIYLMLFIVWIWVLNSKIHHGPADAQDAPAPGQEGFLRAAVEGNEGSMTGMREEDKPAADEEQEVRP